MYSKTLQGGQNTSTAPAVTERANIGQVLQTLFPAAGKEAGGGSEEGGELLAIATAQMADFQAEQLAAEADLLSLSGIEEDKLVQEQKDKRARAMQVTNPLRRAIELNKMQRQWMNDPRVLSSKKSTVEAISRLWNLENQDDVQVAVWGKDLYEETAKKYFNVTPEALFTEQLRRRTNEQYQDRKLYLETMGQASDFESSAIEADIIPSLNSSYFELFEKTRQILNQRGALLAEEEQAYKGAVLDLQKQAYAEIDERIALGVQRGIQVKNAADLYKKVDERIAPMLDIQKNFGDVNFINRSKDLFELFGLAPSLATGVNMQKALNMLSASNMSIQEIVTLAKDPNTAELMKRFGYPVFGEGASAQLVQATVMAIDGIINMKADSIPDPQLQKLAAFWALKWTGKKAPPGTQNPEGAATLAANELKRAANPAEAFEYLRTNPAASANIQPDVLGTIVKNHLGSLKTVITGSVVHMEDGKPVVYSPSAIVGTAAVAVGVPVTKADLVRNTDATKALQSAMAYLDSPGARKALGQDMYEQVKALASGTVLTDVGTGMTLDEANQYIAAPNFDGLSNGELLAEVKRVESTYSSLPLTAQYKDLRGKVLEVRLKMQAEAKKRGLSVGKEGEISKKWTPPTDDEMEVLKVQYQPLVLDAEEKYSLPKGLLTAVVTQESRWDPEARSEAGARGLVQMLPSTAKGLKLSEKDLDDPQRNIDAGARYLSQLLKQFKGDLSMALAAYHDGPGNVRKYGGARPGTSGYAYAHKVLALMKAQGG